MPKARHPLARDASPWFPGPKNGKSRRDDRIHCETGSRSPCPDPSTKPFVSIRVSSPAFKSRCLTGQMPQPKNRRSHQHQSECGVLQLLGIQQLAVPNTPRAVKMIRQTERSPFTTQLLPPAQNPRTTPNGWRAVLLVGHLRIMCYSRHLTLL